MVTNHWLLICVKEETHIVSKKEVRSEETKRSIIAAAKKLFARRGYDHVSIREIAKEAGCSHTTIYIYYQDKEALLHALSMEPLAQLKLTFDDVAEDPIISAKEKLKRLSEIFIRFCLENRSMYAIFFEIKSGRVDDPAPELEINQLRNQMFNIMGQQLRSHLDVTEGEQSLDFSRIYFYMLRGIVGTYTLSGESVDSIMDRLSSTFEDAFQILLNGFRIQMQERGAVK